MRDISSHLIYLVHSSLFVVAIIKWNTPFRQQKSIPAPAPIFPVPITLNRCLSRLSLYWPRNWCSGTCLRYLVTGDWGSWNVCLGARTGCRFLHLSYGYYRCFRYALERAEDCGRRCQQKTACWSVTGKYGQLVQPCPGLGDLDDHMLSIGQFRAWNRRTCTRRNVRRLSYTFLAVLWVFER